MGYGGTRPMAGTPLDKITPIIFFYKSTPIILQKH